MSDDEWFCIVLCFSIPLLIFYMFVSLLTTWGA